MKRLLLITMVFIFSQSGFSQLPDFSRLYIQNYTNFFWAEQIDNSGYLLQSYLKNVNDSLILVKLNTLGDIEWYNKIRYKNYPSFYPKSAAIINSNLIVAASNNFDPANQIVLSAYNAAGDSMWSEIYSSTFNSISVIKTLKKNNREFVVGCIGSNNNVGLICFDSNGNFKWEKFNNLGSVSYQSDMLMLPDSSFIIATSLGILKLNKYGEIISTQTSIKGLTKIQLAENQFLLGFKNSVVYKLDYDGNEVWSKTFTSKTFNDIIYSPSGFYFATLNQSLPPKLFKLNTEGELIEEIDVRSSARSLSICSDNGIVMAGNKFASKTNETGIIKIISDIKPKGGEHLSSFGNIAVSWYSVNVEFVHIELSTDGGSSWSSIIRYYPSSGQLNWETPNVLSDSCLIQVKDSYDFSIYAVSDSLFSIQNYQPYEYIAANEILMWISNHGDGSHDPQTDGNGFYWPGGINSDGKSAIFEDGLCWGGKVNGEIRVNGNTHRQGLLPGNILPNGIAGNPDDPKFRVYKTKKNWEYLPPSPERDKYEYNFMNWPADLGAPWIDNDNDGIYTPGIDKPDYVGDEVLFYVANDVDSNTSRFTYGSDPIGLEFQTTVYAFDREESKNVVFKKYKIINKGINTISDLFFSYWADDDMGDASDDFVGCDTLINLGFTYNGDNDDGIYGTPPPAVGHMFLQTPRAIASENDSAFFDGQWVKGYKNSPLTSFIMYIGGNATYRDPAQGVYQGSIELYNYMNGNIWNGDPFIDPHTGQPTKFILAGDPVSGTGWYEGAGWAGGPPPDDRRYLITTGPISMAPSDTQEVVIAILINKGSDRLNSLTILKQDAEYYQNLFYNNFPVSVDGDNLLIPNEFVLNQNYPNPFNPTTKIKFQIPTVETGHTPSLRHATLKIYDILGRKITTIINKELAPGSYEVEFNGNGLASGIYIYTLQYGSFSVSKKMQLIK